MRTPAYLERLTDTRLVRLFADRWQWVRQVTVTSVAAALAWQVGDIFLPRNGVVAAIAATLTVQVSVHKSVREGFSQILGTSLGAGIGLLSEQLFGLGFITVVLTVGLASVGARALRLGAAAAINVAITALIVIGPGLPESTAWHRLGSIVIGTLIGISLSYFSHPKSPAGRTVDEIAKLATWSAELLGVMAHGVAEGFDRHQAAQWLARGRVLVARVPRVRAQALEARAYSRWFPLAERAEADDLYMRAVALDHAVEQVRNIARTLYDSAVEGKLPMSVSQQISEALSTASYALSASVVELRDEDELPLDPAITEDVRQAGVELAEQLLEERGNVDSEQFGHGIYIATTLGRMADSLDQSAPALHEVPDPGPPTEELVLKLPNAVKRRPRRWKR
ncbi:MAG: FUSC family protein [Candidatus Nanopelagicales bacterium]